MRKFTHIIVAYLSLLTSLQRINTDKQKTCAKSDVGEQTLNGNTHMAYGTFEIPTPLLIQVTASVRYFIEEYQSYSL